MKFVVMAVWSERIDKYWKNYYHAECGRKERAFSLFARAISKPIFLASLGLLKDNSEFRGKDFQIEVAKHVSTEVIRKYYRYATSEKSAPFDNPEAFCWLLIRNAILDARRVYKTKNSPFERFEEKHYRIASEDADGGVEELYGEHKFVIIEYLTEKHCPSLTFFEAQALLLRACLGLSTKEIQKEHFVKSTIQSIDSAIKRAKGKIRKGDDAGFKGFIRNEIK